MRRRHPWLFSGAVARVEGDGSDGVAEVADAHGRILAHGAYSPDSQILARLWTFDGRVPDAALFRERFAAARALRASIVPPETTGYRAVNSEGDRCPGVLLDVYGETAVLELLTAGTEAWRAEIDAAAREVFAPKHLVVRESGAARDRGKPPSPLPLPPAGGEAGSGAQDRAHPSSRTVCASSPTLPPDRKPASFSTNARIAHASGRSRAAGAS